MCSTARRGVDRKSSRRSIRLSKSRLEALVADAVVDAYNEADQAERWSASSLVRDLRRPSLCAPVNVNG